MFLAARSALIACSTARCTRGCVLIPSIHPSTPLTNVQSGKVYKGLWKGTTVAVKVVVLANKMSGAEKVRANDQK